MISSKLSIVDLRNFKLVRNICCTSLLRRAANVLYKIVAYQEYSNSVIEKKNSQIIPPAVIFRKAFNYKLLSAVILAEAKLS